MPEKANLVRNRDVTCRFLYIVGQLGAGGSERQLYLLLQSINRRIYCPHVVVWNFNPNDTYLSPVQKLSVPLHFFPSSLSTVGKMLVFRRIVLKLSPEVIHSYSFYTNIAASWAAFGTKITAVGAVRSNFTYEKRSCGLLRGNLCAIWPSNQIYNNFAAAERVRNSGSLFAPRRVFVVPNRVDLQQFPKTPLFTNGQVRILGIGSLLPYKRWDRLLRAAATLKQRGFDFLIQIVGDGPLRESLERQAQDLGVTDRVKFVGYTNDVSGFAIMLNISGAYFGSRRLPQCCHGSDGVWPCSGGNRCRRHSISCRRWQNRLRGASRR